MSLKILHQSLWGSHAWGHESPESDKDVFRAYQTPTTEILRHPSNERGRSIRNNQVAAQRDEMLHEIGHVVAMLMNGPNCNYVWGLLSPAVEKTTPQIKGLQRILLDYPSKGVFHSSMGLADNNYKDMLLHKPGWDTPKKRRLVMRTLLFARGVIERGVYDFRCVKPDEDFDLTQIGDEFARLKKAYEESTMRPQLPKDMLLDWLGEVRLLDLEESGWLRK